MALYNTQLKTQVFEGHHDIDSPDVVELDEDSIFFSPLPDGKQFSFDENGLPVGYEDVLPKDLAEAKESKLMECIEKSEAALSVITAMYPEFERLSWQKQEEEARAWIKDNSAPTPLLSAIAENRNVELFDLVAKVIVKADSYAVFSGSVIGLRQLVEDKIVASESIEETMGIVVEFAL